MRLEHLYYLYWYCSETETPIYGWMYGTHIKDKNVEDDICKFNNWELELTKDRTGFLYVWGWPGPDYNIYNLDDYGKTWAFSKEELIESIK